MKLIFIAGGGTAGHINPGISVAQAIQKQNSNIKVEFVGTKLGMEGTLVPEKGFGIRFISSAKMNHSGVLSKILGLFYLAMGFFQSLAMIRKHKPDFVLGVGGYASVPMVLASALTGTPTAIWEPNAYPGLANVFLSYFVRTVFLVFESAKRKLKSRKFFVYGMPIRKELEDAQYIFNPQQKLKVLHYGGSQGARSIGRALCDLLKSKQSWLSQCEFVHQTGKVDFEKFKSEYEQAQVRVEVYPYIQDMVKFYQWADVVIARAGASTIAELAKAGKPSILIPLQIADGHQIENAKNLAHKQSAVMILQKDLSPQSLGDALKQMLENQNIRRELHDNIQKFYAPNAADKIANEILSARPS
jgi:UDP-N-acetylglucosamine--N-acetylmuramyl-(pentapeptide) pyrophosphoryl-undecaprenol N-acetylglucosamine transferase